MWCLLPRLHTTHPELQGQQSFPASVSPHEHPSLPKAADLDLTELAERSSKPGAGSEAMAQMVKCLLCKDEDQSSVPKTHVIKANKQVPIASVLGRQRGFLRFTGQSVSPQWQVQGQ